jgi:hypothetical protein
VAVADFLKQIEDGITAELGENQQVGKIVTAGKQILYDEKTREQVWTEIENIGSGSDPRDVAMAVAGLLTVLKRDAKTDFADELLVPAGAILCVEVVRFLQDAEMLEANEEFVGNMIEEFLAIMMQKLQVGQAPERDEPMQDGQQPQGQPQQPQQPPSPEQPPQRGILASA